MPSSAEAARDQIVDAILALERACLDAEAAMVERRAAGVDAALSAQTALTQRLGELFAANPAMTPDNDERVATRLRGVLAYRADQLRRLQSYRDEVGRRLESIGKVRALARTVGRQQPSATFYDTKQ